jgi:2-polyprenyl-3-methyl-5-hydroxy-6-metoxy-1,4-benzoquinol methylase/ribosomal protein S27E
MKSNDQESISHFESLGNPPQNKFEYINCYNCGEDDFSLLLVGQDDLTGKAGNFRYVKCNKCEFVYQNPRVKAEQIKDFYDDDYVAHDRNKNKGTIKGWGFEYGLKQHDKKKAKIITDHYNVTSDTEILDVGCAIGTFLLHMNKNYDAKVSGVDFKDLSNYPEAAAINSYVGLFYEQDFKDKKFDVITMWHFLEHCYDPKRTLKTAHDILADDGKLIIEVPRLDSLTYYIQGRRWPGVQAPQHLTIFDKKKFLQFCEEAGFEVESYMPWGAFPAYFYIYFGCLFRFWGGKGINLDNHFIPYTLGMILLAPILLFEKWLNLCMQTVVLTKKK